MLGECHLNLKHGRDINHELDLGFKQDMEKVTRGQFSARNKEKHLKWPGKAQERRLAFNKHH